MYVCFNRNLIISYILSIPLNKRIRSTLSLSIEICKTNHERYFTTLLDWIDYIQGTRVLRMSKDPYCFIYLLILFVYRYYNIYTGEIFTYIYIYYIVIVSYRCVINWRFVFTNLYMFVWCFFFFVLFCPSGVTRYRVVFGSLHYINNFK